MSALARTLPPELIEALERHGLRQSAPTRPFRGGGLTFRLTDGWIVMERRGTRSTPWARPETGAGLWRTVLWNAPESMRRVFELPLAVLGVDGLMGPAPGGGDPDLWPSVLDWIVSTKTGSPAEGWAAPSVDEVRGWIGDRLTLRDGATLKRGRIIREEDRLALEFPLGRLPVPDLPPARLRWAKAVLLDATRAWRMPRIGVTESWSGDPGGDDGALPREISFTASVDLSGAPSALLPAITGAGLDSLRWVTARLTPTLAVLADPNVRSRSLEIASPWASSVDARPF